MTSTACARESALRRVAVFGEFLDGVPETVESPIRVDLCAQAQCKAIEPLVVPQSRKHGLDCREAPGVARASISLPAASL